jgi:hypothetical protein
VRDTPRSILEALEVSRQVVASTRGRVVRRKRAECLHGSWESTGRVVRSGKSAEGRAERAVLGE